MKGLFRKAVSAAFILISLATLSCEGTFSDLYTALENGADRELVPTSGVHLTGVTATENSISIIWTDPEEDDYDHAVITCSDGAGASTVPEGIETYIRGGLEQSTEYTFTMRAVDDNGNLSESVEFSAETTGGGTVLYHYIYTAEDLDAVRGGIAGYDNWHPEDIYTLMADIDLSGHSSWDPIGDSGSAFTGTMKGNNHTILNLTIDTTDSNQGLFGYVDSGIIEDLDLQGCDVQAGDGDNIGGLAGYITNGTITNCSVSGTVSGDNFVGGLAGVNGSNDIGSSTITGCYATCTVSGGSDVGGLVGRNFSSSDTTGAEAAVSSIAGSHAAGTVSGENNVGGLVGQNRSNSDSATTATAASTISDSCAAAAVAGENNAGGLVGLNYSSRPTSVSEIVRCCATGAVIGNGTSIPATGGLVGENYTSSNGVISLLNCYATGAVTGTDYTGGLVGYNNINSSGIITIANSFAAGAVSGSLFLGGLVGENESEPVSNCFYDRETTGMSDDEGKGTPTSTEDMKTQATFTGWDFETTPIWAIDPGINSGYPYLNCMAP